MERQAGGRDEEETGNNAFLGDQCLSCPTSLGHLLSLLWKHASYAGNGTFTRTPTWCPGDHHVHGFLSSPIQLQPVLL